VRDPVKVACEDTAAILEFVEGLKPFRAVIEASGTYRWLHELLSPHGTVLLAHPLRLRAMIQRRAKTDKLDAQLLANLLRIDQIPLAYVPPRDYQQLRDLTRTRARLIRGQSETKIKLRALLARLNRSAPYKMPFGPRGLAWFAKQDFGWLENLVRDELLARMQHYARHTATIDERLEELLERFPQTEALLETTTPLARRTREESGLNEANMRRARIGRKATRFGVMARLGVCAEELIGCSPGEEYSVRRLAAGRHEWVTTGCAIVNHSDSARSHERQVEPGKPGGFCGVLQHRIFSGMAKAFEGSKNGCPGPTMSQGSNAFSTRPGPGYSSSGCVPAEPDCASPGGSIIARN